MLILTRNIGDSVIINDETFITVYAVQGGQVRLGFDAPKDINILRKELWDKQQRMNGVLIRPNVTYCVQNNQH